MTAPSRPPDDETPTKPTITLEECAKRRHPTNVEVQTAKGRRWTCPCGITPPDLAHDVTEEGRGRALGIIGGVKIPRYTPEQCAAMDPPHRLIVNGRRCLCGQVQVP
jgi:hypothetical protein